MIQDFAEFKHKCLILSFDEFREIMNDLYELSSTDSMGIFWKFDDYEHFSFNESKWAYEKFNIPEITYADLSEFFSISNIYDITRNHYTSTVYIIYD